MQTTEQLIRRLSDMGLTLAVAESCTGGAIAAELVSVSGVSRVLRGGVVAYDPEIKTKLLGVPCEMISHYGVVSHEVAVAMAEGARAELGADLAISTTGIAGPDGGTSTTPVGRVFIGISSAQGSGALCETFSGDRAEIRAAATSRAISYLLQYITDHHVL